MLKRKALGFISNSRCLMALSKLQFSCGAFYRCGLRELDDSSRIKGTGSAEWSRGSALNSFNGLRLKGSLGQSDVPFRSQDDERSRAHAMAPLRRRFRDSRVLGNEVGTQYVNGFGKPLRYPQQWKREKIAVAVDVDEVLGSFIPALNKFVADRYSSYHTVSDYYIYEFFRIWNCTRAEAEIRVHDFFQTQYFTSGIHPIPGAHTALCNLSAFCNLSVVTSRQNVIKDQTCDWIERHFPGLFKEIHFGNHFALDGKSRPKSEICRSIGAKVLIDDNPRYAVECAEAGIRVLLFDYHNSYPWCKDDSVDSYSLVTKVHNWEEVEQHLISWAIV
ncbi:uncharacterized protein LOC110097811 [Dendrobium catenatum]|uniref:uncharacterized protein LOC110097811 n=1 Tax=Dendrobium catenatum TaxID=906689 RepID=UPI0009F1B9BE|nr:uncharacterized protein LOC110097811 [Dendrobium catenatum]